MSGIYVTPTTYVSFAEMNSSSLTREIASRDAAWDFNELMGLLPDPDVVLRKRGDGMEILEELTGDGHLFSVMQQRRLGVMKQEYFFEPGTDDDDTTTSQSEALCRDLQRDLASIKLRGVVSSILNAPYYGMTPVELMFAPGEGRLALVKLETKPARWFGFTKENEPRFKSKDDPEDGEALPWGKFVFARHLPDYDNPYGVRLLSRCFWPVTFKKGGLRFWVQFMEKYGMPFLLGRYRQGALLEEQQSMLDKLQRMVSDAVAVVPDGASVELLGGSGKTGGGYMVFDKMRMAMDAEISKVITQQTLTTEAGERGSYGLGKVHGGVLADVQEADKLLVKEAMDEIGAIYARVNGDGVPAPNFRFRETEDPQKDFADRDKVLQEGGNIRFTKRYYVRRYGLQEDDFEIVENSSGGDDGGGAFDHGDGTRGTTFADAVDEAQEQIERLVDGSVVEGIDICGDLKTAVRQWATTVGSVAAAVEKVAELFDALDVERLSSSMLAALLESERIGRASVNQEFAQAAWGEGRPFREAVDYFKARSFAVAGETKGDVVAMVKDELTGTLEDGGDIKTFRNNLDILFERKGLSPLNDHHIDTIYRTNMQSAYQSGRYVQLTRPEALKARPYWKYVAVRDGGTRPAHRRMHGKVFHHTNPIWQTWYPPNGFNCRCHVVSLSAREVERDGIEVEEGDLSGTPFEVIDTNTGEIKQYVLDPDDGFGAAGGSLEKRLRKQPASERGARQWQEKSDQPGPAELGRPLYDDIEAATLPRLATAADIEQMIADDTLSRAEALERIEESYRKTMGIAPLESQAVLRGKDGAPVIVTMESLAHAMATGADAPERFISHLRRVLEEPFEILRAEYATESGRTRYRKKYVGLFQGDEQQAVAIVAEILPDGTAMWRIGHGDKEVVDRQRHGVEVLYGK